MTIIIGRSYASDMVRAMRARMLVAGMVSAALGLAPAAAAQQVSGDFGGGAVTPPSAKPLGAGGMVIGLHSSADGTTVQVVATITGGCASGSFSASVPVAADGTFSAAGAVRQARTITRYELRGTLSETPSGSATARFERGTARGTRRCSARDVQWQARRPPSAGAFGMAAAVAPGGLLYGASGQLDAGVPRGIALRISPDGRAVSRAIYGVRMSCTGVGTSPTFDLPRDNLAIGPDGRVSDREQGTVKTAATIMKYVERFAATLGSAGGEGMFSVEMSVRRRETGKRITRCRSGIVRWTASP
jgi:hypothetical protein